MILLSPMTQNNPTKHSTKLRLGVFAIGLLLVLLGVLMPTGWYDSLPRDAELPAPPIAGIVLLQISLLVQGLIVCAISLLNFRFVPLNQAQLLAAPTWSVARDGLTARVALTLLAGITLLALALRLVNLNSDLWLDEISTVVVYGPMSLLEVIGGYINFNNHLLNTLLVKLSIGLFGETEWAVRLPVALLGTATMPVIYWITRQMGFSRWVCLGIALVVAVSYHHIFFSQNARGYIGHVLFTLAASGILVRALQTDRLRLWLLYLAVMVLNFATLLTTAYVLAAHGIVGVVALYIILRRGVSPLPLLQRLTVVFGLVGFLAFQMYALILPHALVRLQAKYTGDGGYFSLFSVDLLTELVRGLSAAAGIGSGPLALLILAAGAMVAGLGFVSLIWRNWSLTLALSLPVALSLLFIVINGLTFSPRFMLPALPVGIFAVVLGVHVLARFAGQALPQAQRQLLPRLAVTGLVVLIVAVSLLSLKTYYGLPKQAYRASIEYLETQRAPGEVVIVADLAEQGFRYYIRRMGTEAGQDYYFVQSVADLEAVVALNRDGNSYLVTTLPRFLRLRKPDLEARIERDWQLLQSFPGTIGNGQIVIWASKQLPKTQNSAQKAGSGL
ncbi:MAG: glycosyltransferase family 39 protein [Chloroflexi bacterium]|nr:glycosyltransferase family 39 protein [Chloroflexota bacterium]